MKKRKTLTILIIICVLLLAKETINIRRQEIIKCIEEGKETSYCYNERIK